MTPPRMKIRVCPTCNEPTRLMECAGTTPDPHDLLDTIETTVIPEADAARYRETLPTADWELINAALAYYQAAVEGGDLNLPASQQRRHEHAVAAIRAKVHDALNGS